KKSYITFQYILNNFKINIRFQQSHYRYNRVINKLESTSVDDKKTSYLKWKNIINQSCKFPTLMNHSYNLHNSDREKLSFKLNLSTFTGNIEHAIFISFIRAIYDIFNISHNENIAFHLMFNARAIPTFEFAESFYNIMGTFHDVIPVYTNYNKVSGNSMVGHTGYINNIVSDGKDFCLLRKELFKSFDDERNLFRTLFNIFKSEKTNKESSFIKSDRVTEIWPSSMIFVDECKIEYLLEYNVIITDDMLQMTIFYSKYHYNESIITQLNNKIAENFHKLTN
ncbi:hypothetical protein, partial [Francisella sp. 19X1-34]|uniref:hypothetical protein n=1 Tax=Francisella sp. 19X1-34 TaxID=3087177 RepID=UPI002E32E375